MKEDHIFLEAGNYSGIDLLGKLRSDLKDLGAYVYVSSLSTWSASLTDPILITSSSVLLARQECGVGGSSAST